MAIRKALSAGRKIRGTKKKLFRRGAATVGVVGGGAAVVAHRSNRKRAKAQKKKLRGLANVYAQEKGRRQAMRTLRKKGYTNVRRTRR